jgi:hypothetical protein
MSKHTLEQVLEHLINKEDEKASELLHQFFVAKGKSIYEELSSLDDHIEEEIGGSAQEDFQDEIIEDEADLEDERLFAEAEDEEADPMAAEPSEEEATMDLAMGTEDDAAEEEGEEEGEEEEAGEEEAGEEESAEEEKMERVDDALAELKDLFAELMGDTSEESVEEEMSALGENVATMEIPVTHVDGSDNTKSPVSSGAKVSSNGASAVKISGNVEKGGTGATVKDMATGNVGTVPGNKKAPALTSVAAPKKAE